MQMESLLPSKNNVKMIIKRKKIRNLFLTMFATKSLKPMNIKSSEKFMLSIYYLELEPKSVTLHLLRE